MPISSVDHAANMASVVLVSESNYTEFGLVCRYNDDIRYKGLGPLSPPTTKGLSE